MQYFHHMKYDNSMINIGVNVWNLGESQLKHCSGVELLSAARNASLRKKILFDFITPQFDIAAAMSQSYLSRRKTYSFKKIVVTTYFPIILSQKESYHVIKLFRYCLDHVEPQMNERDQNVNRGSLPKVYWYLPR